MSATAPACPPDPYPGEFAEALDVRITAPAWLDYDLNFTAWLGSETIAAHVVHVDNVELDGSELVDSARTVRARLRPVANAQPGDVARVTYQITDTAGRQTYDDRIVRYRGFVQ